MVERPEKSVVKAYVYLALLGPLGGHCYYLKRPGKGLFLAVLSITAVAAFAVGLYRDQNDLTYLAYFTGAVASAMLLADLVMIPGIIEGMNDRGEDRRVAVIAGNLDPSFQATLKRAGRDDPARPRKSALPEGYERPWHKDKNKTNVYRPGED